MSLNVPGPAIITADSIPDGVIEDQHVSETADIQRDKLEPGSAGHVLINDGSGNPSSEAQLALTRGGTGASTASGARTALELGNSATRNVGTTAGTVAAGDDPRFSASGALLAANNLSDLASASTARTNLGLGTAATHAVPASGDAASGEVVKGSDTRLTNSRAPSGSAGGDVSGTYPTSLVVDAARGVRETSGPTVLAAGAIADGEFLKRVGSTLVSAAVSSGGDTSSAFPMGVPFSAAALSRVWAPPQRQLNSSGSGSAITADELHAQPLWVPDSLVGVALRVAVHSRATVAGARLYGAIYSATSDTNPYPSARVAVSTEVAGVSISTFETFSFTFTPSAAGLYWLSVNVSSAALTTLTTYANTRYVSAFGVVTTNPAYGLSVASAYGVPPATYPAGAAYVTAPPVLLVSRD